MHEIIYFGILKTNKLTLFSEKLEHVSIFDPRGTLKVNDSHSEVPQYVAYQKNVAYEISHF